MDDRDPQGKPEGRKPDLRTPQSASAALTGRERDILAFERQWWRFAGAKEQAIRDQFDMTSTRYHQVLNALIDTDAALVADPTLVKRLRRLREQRQRQRRAAGRFTA